MWAAVQWSVYCLLAPRRLRAPCIPPKWNGGVHAPVQGDGTAAIFAGDPSVYTLSLHCGAQPFPHQLQVCVGEGLDGVGRRGEVWGGVGRCGQVWADVGRCGQTWAGVGRCGAPPVPPACQHSLDLPPLAYGLLLGLLAPSGFHLMQQSDLDVALPAGTSDDQYLQVSSWPRTACLLPCT